MMYEKPLPIVDQESRPYWDALKQHRLLIKSCRGCGQRHFYPRELCPHCHSDELDWIEAAGEGVIYSYTVARRPAGPAFKADAPYVVAIITLAEGPRMMSNIITDQVDAVRIGQRVKLLFEDVTDEITLPKFQLA
ncbi:MAG: Zn-ribbon domain-containing OB-fold protein [Sulfuricaulis sp.]|nr:Zn-ribbon domain-containing OB-fold protein [Sulfuricaulis sp.]